MSSEADFGWIREMAQDEETVKKVDEIERLHREVYEKGKFLQNEELIPLNLRKHRIWVRKCSAWFSAIIFTQIFKENHHLKVKGFSGKNSDLVVDLGASEGYYTLKVKENNPDCRVIAIEPNPYAFEILKKNVESNNLEEVELIQKAIGPSAGETTLEVLKQSSAVGSNIKKPREREWVKEDMTEEFKVKVLSLGNLFKEYDVEEIDILKIDIVGGEYKILKGSEELLSKINKIVTEVHVDELRKKIKNLLERNGFKFKLEETEEFGDLYFTK